MSEFSEIELCVSLIVLISLVDIASYSFMTSLRNAFWGSHCWVVLVWSFLAVAKIRAESSTKALKLLTGVVLLHFVKFFMKHLKFKHCKLSFCWIELFRVLKWIDDQAYHLALSDKYVWLHDMFSIQLLEIYCHWDDDKNLMTMSDLKDLQDE